MCVIPIASFMCEYLCQIENLYFIYELCSGVLLCTLSATEVVQYYIMQIGWEEGYIVVEH